MPDPILIICPTCSTTNRVPHERLGAGGKCGRCGGALFDAHPVALGALNFEAHLNKSGIPLLVDFWASWCGPCRQMMPALNRLSQRYGAQGLTVLGVTDEPASVARSVGMQMSIRYTLATSPTGVARFNVQSLPTLVAIDRAGRVREVAVGFEGPARLEALVTRLLAEPTP